jgi:hypothetical protein
MMMRTTALIALSATLIVACSADADEPARSATPVTTTMPAPTTSPPTVPPTTSAPTTTTMSVTTGIVLPPDLGQLVASAPGVATPGDIWQLAPKLWMFLPSESAGDPNLTPPRPEDAEILIAYARKVDVLFSIGTVAGEPFDLTGLDSVYTPAGLQQRLPTIEQAQAAGHYQELGDGVVVRPRVLSEPRSDLGAVVFDCRLTSSYIALPSGEPAPGERRGHRTIGLFSKFELTEHGHWKTALDGSEELACAG